MTQSNAPRSLFETIVEHMQANQHDVAIARCREALSRYPSDINLLALLGAALGDQGEFEEAESALRKVIDLAPTFAKPYEDLGILFMHQKRPEAAVPLLEKATRLDSKLEAAHFQLGVALAAIGRGKEADTAFEQSFELSPTRKMMALAGEHHQAGRLQDAEQLCRKVLQQNPKQVDALRMLGLIAAAAGDLDEAESLLRQALVEAPDHVPAMFELGRVLKELDRNEDAIEVYQAVIKIQPDNAKAWFRLGGTLGPAALTEQAVDAYKQCLQLNPNHAGAWLGLGHMLKTLGQQEEGIAAYQRCREIEPDLGEVYYSLANLKTYRFDDEELTQMKQRVESDAVKNTSEVNFLFALAKALDDRGEFEQAWHYYERGNANQRMLVSYDPVMTETTNDDLISYFSRDCLSRFGGAGNPDQAPIFVLGMPRSGSTLVEQIIASHSQVEGTSELPYIGRLSKSLNRNRADGMRYPQVLDELEPRHFHQLGSRYLEMASMHRVEGAPRFIDKMPNNFPSVGFIHCLLPNAKIIDARRHPMDTCVGNLRQLYARGQTFSYDQVDLGEYYLQYQRMMDHWEEVLPGKVLRVQYEDTVNDLESQVSRILEFLGLPWEDQCLNFHTTDRAVRTASSEQVRQPIYTSGVGYWKNYETHLDELHETLEPILSRY
ncbi:MAG: tetratricopeptide (TPR) repeat protein [Halieaceae bacterium]|jgi:tetratricopeptide (TPR) repeat protein